MADNTRIPLGTQDGDTIALDDIAGVKVPRSKIMLGADGVNDGDVSAANPLPVTGTVTANLGATDNAVLDAIAASLAGTLTVGSHAVTNAGTFACQVTSAPTTAVTNAALAVTGGGVEASALRVTLANDSTGVLSVDDNGGSLTIDGTVAATQSGTWNVGTLTNITNVVQVGDNGATLSIDDGAGSITVDGTVAVSGSVTVVNAGTFACQIDGAALTALQLIDDPIATIGGVPLNRVAIYDGSGSQITSFGGGVQYTEGDTDASITGTAAMMEVAGNALAPVQGTVSDGLLVNLGSNNDVTVSGAVTANAGSGTFAVSGPLTDTQLRATPVPVSVTGGGDATAANQTTIIGHVDGIEGLLTTIDADTGTLAAVDFATGSDVASLGVVGPGVEATALRVTIASDSTGVVSIDDNGGSVTVDGTVAATQSGTWTVTGTGGTFPVTDSGGSLTVDNATLSVVGGGTEATAMRVTIASDSTGVLSVDDGGGSITIDGTVSISGAVDTELTTADLDTGAGTDTRAVVGMVLAASGGGLLVGAANPMPVSDNGGSLTIDGTVAVSGAVTVSSHDVTNAGTFLVQAAQSGTWNVTNISGTVSLPTGAATAAKQPALGTAGTASADVITVQGIASMTALKVDGSAVTQPVSGTFWQATQPVSLASVPSHAVTNAGTFAVQIDGAALTALQLLDDAISGTEMQVDIVAALPAGTNAIGKLAANAGVTIGAVEIAAAQTLATVTTVTTCSTVTTLTGGGVAHDSADSGNPHKIGAKAETSPKGITLVADGDRTDLYADADGMLMVKLNTSGADVISEAVSDTGGSSTAFTNFSAVASTKNYITSFSVFRTDAGTTPIYVDFRDGTGGGVLWRVVIPPNGGANSPPCAGPALFKTSANTALAYDVSAATTTVYISVSGYQSKI